jgi:hypothetical protein
MPETPTAAELEIPPAAVDAYFVCGCSESGIRAGYKPEALPAVVAAELRRIADEPGMGFMTGPHDVSAANRLRARADELDPPARQED